MARARITASFAALLFLMFQTAYGQETESSNSPATSHLYVIAANDLLDVSILDVPELSREYRVSGIGTLEIPLLAHPIRAGGVTISELQSSLESELKQQGIVTNPHVAITVRQSEENSTVVSGAVKKPVVYFTAAPVTLLDALSRAEGVSEDAGSVATITRGVTGRRVLGQNGPASSSIDLRRLLQAADLEKEELVYPGDRVTVPRAGVVYVVGAVNKAGGFPLSFGRERISVLQAIALAEDLKPTAMRDKAEVLRRGADGTGKEMIPIPLKQILAGKKEDLVLAPNDILFIPDSTGRRALRRGAEAALQAATGVAIYSRW